MSEREILIQGERWVPKAHLDEVRRAWQLQTAAWAIQNNTRNQPIARQKKAITELKGLLTIERRKR